MTSLSTDSPSRMSLIISRIPVELFREIQVFTSSIDYWRLMTTSKENFQPIKYETILFTLHLDDPKSSLLSSSSTMMKNPEKQLKINALKFFTFLENYFPSSQFTCEEYQSYLSLPALSFICHCNNPMSEPRLTNFADPKNLFWMHYVKNKRHVYLQDNDRNMVLPDLFPQDKEGEENNNNKQILTESLHISWFTKLVDISSLGTRPNSFSHLKEISFTRCNQFQDLSCLKNLSKLSLITCQSIKTVEELGKIHCLILRECDGIEDITPLTNNYQLIITGCKNVKRGFSSLINVFSLETDLIKNHARSLHLKSVRLLTLTKYNDEEEIYLNSLLMEVKFTMFEHLISLPVTFARIQRITLDWCYNLSDISCLRESRALRSISLNACSLIKDFSPLKSIKKVKIRSCDGFTNGYDVDGVENLTLVSCSKIEKIDMLGNLKFLELNGCPEINTLTGLGKIKEIKILNCMRLTSLEGLGENTKITLLLNSKYQNKSAVLQSYRREVLSSSLEVFLRINAF